MEKKVFVAKEFKFDSAHKLEWHEGKCKKLHGHTYKLQVIVKGNLNKNGIIIDFEDLKEIVKREVLKKLDHEFLNKIIKNPTSENIAVWIWNKLKYKLNLHEINLYETPTSFVTIKNES
jgi:6-pyruvoyltetrahydropterin/6-carboxytetrahydropterin synthase